MGSQKVTVEIDLDAFDSSKLAAIRRKVGLTIPEAAKGADLDVGLLWQVENSLAPMLERDVLKNLVVFYLSYLLGNP